MGGAGGGRARGGSGRGLGSFSSVCWDSFVRPSLLQKNQSREAKRETDQKQTQRSDVEKRNESEKVKKIKKIKMGGERVWGWGEGRVVPEESPSKVMEHVFINTLVY